MNIGEAAKRSGVTAKMIRHYEAIGLIARSQRTEAGYRHYDEQDLHALRFIRHARDLGFSLAQIETLLSLWQDQERASADVKQMAEAHVVALDARIQALMAMRDTLATLASHCQGDSRPSCPILAGLETGDAGPAGCDSGRHDVDDPPLAAR